MSVDLQKRIKDDQEDVQQYVQDLTQWEGEIAKKDEELKRKAVNNIAAFPPIRGTKESEIPRMSEKEEKALTEKELGNTAFKRGKLDMALRHYSKSLEYWPGSAVVYSNRAQVHIKRKEYSEANKDATTAIKLTSSGMKEQCTHDNIKAYYRRALARENLKLYNQAKADLHTILEFVTKNSDPKDAVAEIKDIEKATKRINAALRQIDDELEDKRGRKKLVIEEIDEDEDEDETPAKQAVNTPNKGRSVVIEEVDDDSDEEDVPVTIKKKEPVAASAPVPEKVPPKSAPAPKPKARAKSPPKPAVPFVPKSAHELRRGGTSVVIEEISDDDEEEDEVAEPSPPKAAPTPPTPAAKGPKKIAIEEIDEDDEEGEPAPAPAVLAAPSPKAAPTPAPKSPSPKTTAAKEAPAASSKAADRPAQPSKRVTALADQPPANYFEFEEVWRELRSDLTLLTPYILKIEAPAFKTLFRTSLTHDILVDVVRCLDGALPSVPSEEAAYHALRVLYQLSLGERFGEQVMFMTAEEKAWVTSLFTKAQASGMPADKISKAKAKLAEFGL
uniref:RNA polymerase II-associated protein 3 n=1 Tax=Eutreptiella gymnastica TaxID=73025 RepID=A0A6U8EMG5_9EUGL|mmetsp:Transcript_37124/g.66198  ORF Transcript_37124/g.66198 Transcript_37124/m.66198 type:complete len:558 (+) Transcript_37124:32-1705(+)